MAYVRGDEGWQSVPGSGLDDTGRYRWEFWADGSLWFIRRTEDYLGGHEDVIKAAHSYAWRRGAKVSCSTVRGAPGSGDPGGVMLQFRTAPQVCTGGLNGGPLPHSRMCTPCAGRDVCRYKP